MSSTIQTLPSVPTAPRPQYPQAPWLPVPLVLHPLVDPELARGLIAAVEYVNEHNNEFDMQAPYFWSHQGRGCLICHAERLSSWKRDEKLADLFPTRGMSLGNYCRIFWPSVWKKLGFNHDNHTSRMARVEQFLRTGL